MRMHTIFRLRPLAKLNGNQLNEVLYGDVDRLRIIMVVVS